ncbi:MAG: pyrroline-5-carboxylate reductase [Anaerolineaceae bacterium]|jgi:pyrroline-5-carboxylate reductase|nr:pyrroline-5-carboxylate reductase [Anaerolineaceae bacterium]
MLEKMKVAVIGPGVMGEAILSCLVNSHICAPQNVTISGPEAERNQHLQDLYHVQITTDNGQAVANADFIVLAVKPQRFNQVARSIKGKLKPDAVVLSVIAGIKLESLAKALDHANIVRTMPNTPVRISKGITVWTTTESVTEAQKQSTIDLLTTLGEEVYVDDESYLDMATAVSGTGPAYVFLFMEAMIDAAVHLGFPRRIAEQLVSQTILGSVEFYRLSKDHPAKLRNEVTSPGGTSAEALYYLEKAGFRTAISRAILAAYERSQELGQGIQTKLDSSKE